MPPNETIIMLWIAFSVVIAFITWLSLSFIVAWIAKSKGRSLIGMFLLSLFLSPIVGFIIVAFMKTNDKTFEEETTNEESKKKKTEIDKVELAIEKNRVVCFEITESQHKKCKSCGSDNSPKLDYKQIRTCPICGVKELIYIRDDSCQTCGRTDFEDTFPKQEIKPVPTCPVCGGTDVSVKYGYCETCKRRTFEGEWQANGKRVYGVNKPDTII